MVFTVLVTPLVILSLSHITLSVIKSCCFGISLALSLLFSLWITFAYQKPFIPLIHGFFNFIERKISGNHLLLTVSNLFQFASERISPIAEMLYYSPLYWFTWSNHVFSSICEPVVDWIAIQNRNNSASSSANLWTEMPEQMTYCFRIQISGSKRSFITTAFHHR